MRLSKSTGTHLKVIALSNEIAFTDDHIEKIRNGEKRSTMRTVKRKNLYPVNGIVRIKGTDTLLRIRGREVLRLGPEGVTEFDEDPFSPSVFCRNRPPMEVLADWEGFENPDEMIQLFEGENPWGVEYDLPQPFYLYVFEEIDKGGKNQEG